MGKKLTIFLWPFSIAMLNHRRVINFIPRLDTPVACAKILPRPHPFHCPVLGSSLRLFAVLAMGMSGPCWTQRLIWKNDFEAEVDLLVLMLSISWCVGGCFWLHLLCNATVGSGSFTCFPEKNGTSSVNVFFDCQTTIRLQGEGWDGCQYCRELMAMDIYGCLWPKKRTHSPALRSVFHLPNIRVCLMFFGGLQRYRHLASPWW